jgi:hypothetical protein
MSKNVAEQYCLRSRASLSQIDGWVLIYFSHYWKESLREAFRGLMMG